MFIGEFAPSIFFKVPTYVIIATLFIIYYVSQIYGHEPPFPHCWISDCAGHFPQFVLFRIATISGSAMIALGWLTNHFYLKTISKEQVFRIDKYHPEIPMILGMIGAMLLMGSTANIDTGKRDGKWHTFCASKFFIFTLVAQIYNTVVCSIVYSKIKTLSRVNLYCKQGLVGLMLVQLYISTSYGGGVFEEEKEFGSVINVILQWTLTATVTMGFYSMGVDVDKFKFVYEATNGDVEDQSIETVD